MTIKDILRSKGSRVITGTASATIFQAVNKMVENRVGALVIVDEDNSPVGIFTERDVLRQVDSQCDKLTTILVGDVMTKDLIIGIPDDDVDAILEIMTKHRMRHLPVLDEGKLVGIVSIGDIAKVKLTHTAFEVRHMRDYIMGKI